MKNAAQHTMATTEQAAASTPAKLTDAASSFATPFSNRFKPAPAAAAVAQYDSGNAMVIHA